MIAFFLPIYEQYSELFTLNPIVLPIDHLSSITGLPVKGLLIISYPPINPKP